MGEVSAAAAAVREAGYHAVLSIYASPDRSATSGRSWQLAVSLVIESNIYI